MVLARRWSCAAPHWTLKPCPEEPCTLVVGLGHRALTEHCPLNPSASQSASQPSSTPPCQFPFSVQPRRSSIFFLRPAPVHHRRRRRRRQNQPPRSRTVLYQTVCRSNFLPNVTFRLDPCDLIGPSTAEKAVPPSATRSSLPALRPSPIHSGALPDVLSTVRKRPTALSGPPPALPWLTYKTRNRLSTLLFACHDQRIPLLQAHPPPCDPKRHRYRLLGFTRL